LNIVIVCETLNRYRFFRRMVPALTRKGHKAVFLSNRLSIVLIAKKDGNHSHLINSYHFFKNKKGQNFGLGFDASVNEIKVAIEQCIYNLFEKHSITTCFFWNGSSFLSKAIQHLAKQYKCETLFFEIGNFPGKIFVDPCGVNAQSWYAAHYGLLKDNSVDHNDFEKWRSNFLLEKLSKHQVPQSKFSTKFNWLYPLDVFGFYCLFAVSLECPNMFRKTRNFLQSKKIQYDYDEFNPAIQPGYVFFPLQVSTDSQLIVNSDVDNIQALYLAAQIAKDKNVPLIVKPHPAESNRLFVMKLTELRKELGFLFVDVNTFQLINYCSLTVTINSTVGMEAMLLKKPITVFGRAIYERFEWYDLMLYIGYYLLAIDFFCDETITENQLDLLFHRMKIHD